MQRSEPTAMVEIALLDNRGDVTMIEDVERMALGHAIKVPGAPRGKFVSVRHGTLHWGQSNGKMTRADVAKAFPKKHLKTWKAVQRELGGATFTNEFMRRCGLA
jgi:hypothetical protein